MSLMQAFDKGTHVISTPGATVWDPPLRSLGGGRVEAGAPGLSIAELWFVMGTYGLMTLRVHTRGPWFGSEWVITLLRHMLYSC